MTVAGKPFQTPASSIEQKLNGARSRLLDLSLRNKLINFRPSSRRSIRVMNDDLAKIYQELVIEERALSFRAAKKQPLSEIESQTETNESGADEQSESTPRRYRASLRTELEPEALPRRLFSIANEANSVLEEQGYTVLYLALGFLEWKESASSENLRLAPLLLIPVELSRTKVRESYRLSWTKEDVGTNLSLLERLADCGVALPEFEMPDDSRAIDSYYRKVARAISKKPDWKVSDQIHLGFFSFTKFVMYKDLDPDGWPEGAAPADHPLIRELFAAQGRETPWEIFEEDEIDDALDWKTVNHVMDADPSQIVAIESVKAGANLVVEGPPGTGKSQTIANIIGELLSGGKSVLFVSQKMAALEVVKQRLDRVGLGDFCLELHSRKARKKEILTELERCLKNSERASKEADERLRSQLASQIGELNEYVRQLREPFGSLNVSPFGLIEMREAGLAYFERQACEVPEATLSEKLAWTQTLVDEALRALDQLLELRGLLKSGAVAAWTFCHPGQLLPADTQEIRGLLERTRDLLDTVSECAEDLADELRLHELSSLSSMPVAREACLLLSDAPELDVDAVLSSLWTNLSEEETTALLDSLEDLQLQKAGTLAIFIDEALHIDAKEYCDRIAAIGVGPFSPLKSRFRALGRELCPYYRKKQSFFYRQYAEDLAQLSAYQGARDQLLRESDRHRTRFGVLWRDEYSDAKKLREFAKWAHRFHKGITGRKWKESLADLAASQTADAGVLYERTTKLEQNVEEAENLVSACLERLGVAEQALFGGTAVDARIRKLVDRIETWLEHLSDLYLWARYSQAQDAERLRAMPSVVRLVDQQDLEREDIEPLLNYLIAEEQLTLVFKDRPALADFVSTLHEDKIQRFRELDTRIVEANRERLRAELNARKPTLIGGVSPDSGMGILQREINKKRRHISIRKLMEDAGDIIQRAKPCFMMSPLSIAQFLDPRTTRFDVIVFDEASQVRPEDALGALLRGNQLVVMGDTKQLPPTSFFDRLVEDDGDDENSDSVGDVESILHLCRRSFPSKQLRWHYRSQHESLIEVSNHEFYDNNLVVYPSPMQSDERLGLKFRHISDTVYDRGKSSENRMEARAVARAAIQHFKSTPDRSLGVGAFSSKQQNAILEEVQKELEDNPEMEGYFSSGRDEHFFVKNLETIQGDERDVIFLSVGYGFDANHKLWNNFGPLNQEGGERRLNVLITRARKQCVVFSNFRADDLAVDGGAARGVRALKTFLKYAESGILEYPQTLGRDTDSPFEDAVCEFLCSEGHEVHKQVGSTGFRIDLAICDSTQPGRYILGIECDGAKYHSSRVARERDRLRQQILEGLGWQIHRVWSTDWFVNRKLEQERLLRAVESAKNAPKSYTRTERDSSRTKSNKIPPKAILPMPKQDIEIVQELPTHPYKECKHLSIPIYNDIPSTARATLAKAVLDVVKVESPIHVEEVTRRIRTLWGLKRSGNRIQEAVARGGKSASSQKMVTRKGNFLWLPNQQEADARCRSAREMLKIDLICDEEIASAIMKTLEIQYASPKDAIPTTAARLLGFHQTSDQIRKSIFKVLQRMLKDGELVDKGDGRIDLAARVEQ